GEVVDWLASFLEGAGESWFDDVASDIEDAREDIVCAILQGASLHDTIENVLSPGLAWTLFYSLINYDGVQATLYEGGIEDEYLPTELRDDCYCDLPEGYNWQDAEEITFNLEDDTWGRVNEANVTEPEIEIGKTVATSASWGCATYPAGCLNVYCRNSVYQTLAVRMTIVSNDGDNDPYFAGTCRGDNPTHSHIIFYTLDVAEGIDADWADTQADSHHVQNTGHAKRDIDHNWDLMNGLVSDSTPGATPVYVTFKLEHLVWVP
ncbi:unnamed protein product, partial [marine sediment metagenome]